MSKRRLEDELELPPANRPIAPWNVDWGGHRIEVDAESGGGRVRLWIDGEQAVFVDGPFSSFRIGRSEVLVAVQMKGEVIKRAELLVGHTTVALVPPHGKVEGTQEPAGEEPARQPTEGDVEARREEPAPSPPARWTGECEGRSILVEGDQEASEVRLCVDGREVALVGDLVGKNRFGGGGFLVEVRVGVSGALKRVDLVTGDRRVPLEPPPDTTEGRRELARRARREDWRRSRLHGWIERARARRRLAEDSPWRHLVRGALRVAIPLVGVTALLGLLPDVHLPLPSIHLDLPTIPSPASPTLSLPGWLEWLLERSHFVIPILIGLGLSLVELRRRRRGHRDPGAAQTKVERLGRRILGQGRDRN
jgi:hypothetical protein